nr:sodium channel protein Nach-like [Danaus plexippus plexippus]
MNSKIWWREYRRRKRGSDARDFSTESILRKTFKATVKDYIDNCSLSGLKQVCEPNTCITQRIFFFCVMLAGVFYFLQYLWYGNISKPLIIVMDSSTYPISSIDFPAVTICNFNRISKAALENYVQKFQQRNNHRKDAKGIREQLLQLGRLIDYSYNKTLLNGKFQSFEENLENYDGVVEIMKELSPPCDKMLIKCSWLGVIQDCNKLFKVHLTVRGHCCSFNHISEHQDTNRSEIGKFQAERQIVPGIQYGLNVILDAMIEDYSYSLYNMKGFEIFIFESSHFGDPTGGRVIQKITQPDYLSFFEIYSVKQTATPEVRKYKIGTRKCYFQDELKKQFKGLYSYSQCIMNCRIKAVQSLCKCTPYYYKDSKNQDMPVCTIQHLRCLNKHMEKFIYLYPKNAESNEGLDEEIQNALRCLHCLPDCEVTRHFTKQSRIELTRLDKNKKFLNFYLKGINMSNKGLVTIYQGKGTGVLTRLDIVSYWYEIVSNIGGFCSILILY